MQDRLRQFAVASAAITLIFFCSCERHRPEELAGFEQDVKTTNSEHAFSSEHKEQEKARGHEHGAVTPAPASPTPADFFPQSSPR